MPSVYLSGADLATYGVPNATSAQITQASTLVDAYLRRPEGLVWMPDSTGNPCYMAALVPQMTFTLAQPISPGSGVVAQLSGPTQILQVGDALTLDRGSSGLTETVIVATTTSPPYPSPNITFQTVINAHAEAATADLGMCIEEQRYMPDSRPITFMSRTPLVNVVSGVGRYAYGRRGESANYNMEQFNLLAAVSKFGGPPAWELFQQTYPVGWDLQTGQLWCPAGILIQYYSEVKIRYVAGFSSAAIPPIVKLAVSEMIQATINMPQLGAVKSYKAGDTAITMAAASVLSDDTKTALQSYAARMWV